MKSTKYQLLESEYRSSLKRLKEYRLMIEQLRKEKEQVYYDGYKQGRFDEKMLWLNQDHD